MKRDSLNVSFHSCIKRRRRPAEATLNEHPNRVAELRTPAFCGGNLE